MDNDIRLGVSVKKVSIIIVNYNGYIDTMDCIDSLSNIDYPDYEIIIVDNKSTDVSLSHLKQKTAENIQVLESGENLGFSGGNNLGIEYAISHGAEYLLLLNNDTMVESGFLTKLVECAERYKNSVAVTSKIYYANQKNILWYAGGSFNLITSRISHTGVNEEDKGQYDQEKVVTFASGCCILIPKGVIDVIGKMNEDYFLYCEDIDLCCAIKKAGFELIYNPESVIYHKVNGSTGKISDAVTYYMERNKLYIISSYISLVYRPAAYIYFFAEMAVRIIKKEYTLSGVACGVRDYILKKKGKKKTD